MKAIVFSAAVTAAMLSGCATLDHRTGTEVTQKQLDTFTKGKTRQADIISAIGHPSQKSENKGREVWTYNFTLIAMAPWQGNKNEATVFEFDKNGVLLDAYKTGGRPGTSGNPMLDAAGM